MAVKRVVNQSGPQTVSSRQDGVSQHTLQTSHTAEFPPAAGINERLSSMETHVKLCAGKYIEPILVLYSLKNTLCMH